MKFEILKIILIYNVEINLVWVLKNYESCLLNITMFFNVLYFDFHVCFNEKSLNILS